VWGHVRVPVPVGALILAVIIVLANLALQPAPSPPAGSSTGFANFEPVKDLNPRIIRSAYEDQ
jgi:hypothetical protein